MDWCKEIQDLLFGQSHINTDWIAIAKTKKSLVYDDLILPWEDGVAFGLVDEACTETFPDEDIHFEFTKLKSKYKSK